MAVTKVLIALPTTRRTANNQFRVSRKLARIFNLTKLSGDTTYTLDTGMQSAHEVIILDDTGAVISGAAGTTGVGGAGTFSSALTGLGAGTFVTVIVIGNSARR